MVYVSIIIPAFDEENCIGECLTSLFKQSFKNYEIIVVDDGSTDGTCQIVRGFKGVRLIEGEHKGPGISRNIGSEKAKGEILVFVDADMTFDRYYLKNLIKPILHDKTNRIIGTTHDYEVATNTKNIWSKLWGQIRVAPKKLNDEGYADGPIIFRAIRKKVFLKVGGFDPDYGYADDQSLFLKHGLRPVVAQNTRCYHKNPETLNETFKQSRWIGSSIQTKFFEGPVKHFSLIFLIFISPLAIPIIALKKGLDKKNLKLLFPWMILFITIRYFGTISGIIRKTYRSKNIR